MQNSYMFFFCYGLQNVAIWQQHDCYVYQLEVCLWIILIYC